MKLFKKAAALSVVGVMALSLTACSSSVTDFVDALNGASSEVEIVEVDEDLYDDLEESEDPEEELVLEEDVVLEEPEEVEESEEPEESNDEVLGEIITETVDGVEITINPKTYSSMTDLTWDDCTFTLDGVQYTVPFDYSEIAANGWTFDLSDYGYDNGYYLNVGDTVAGTITLTHEDYDCEIKAGFTNNGDALADITECQIHSVSIESRWTKLELPSIELAGGATWGTTADEFLLMTGDTDDTYRAEELAYTVYDYDSDFSIYYDATIYDDGGLVAFSYRVYD